jgi:hypothetical protein
MLVLRIPVVYEKGQGEVEIHSYSNPQVSKQGLGMTYKTLKSVWKNLTSVYLLYITLDCLESAKRDAGRQEVPLL